MRKVAFWNVFGIMQRDSRPGDIKEKSISHSICDMLPTARVAYVHPASMLSKMGIIYPGHGALELSLFDNWEVRYVDSRKARNPRL